MSNPRTLKPYSDESNDYFCNKFIAEASKSYKKKMLELGSPEELRASVPCVDLKEHLCYCLEPLYSKDGHREYQFLIEYHTRRPSEGIYYGCRGITLKNFDHQEETCQFRKDWEIVEAEVCTILNNTFPKKDFSRRFKITDNANDQTYWLFWISLVEDEDIKNVGVRATKIIRNVFERYLDGEKFDKKKKPSKKPNDETAFTDDNLKHLFDRLKNRDNSDKDNEQMTQNAQGFFNHFVEDAIKKDFIFRNNNYEFAWQAKLSNTDFAFLINAFFDYVNAEIFKRGELDKKTPWGAICKLFLNNKGLAFDNALKTQLNQTNCSETTRKRKEKQWNKIVEESAADYFF